MLKRLIIGTAIGLATVALAAFGLSRFAVDVSLPDWAQNAPGYESALAQQRATGKPIALFFHTEWCSNCKQLRKSVLAQKRSQAYFSKYIPVQINPEISPAERAIADAYGVYGYPTFLIVHNQQVVPVRRTHNVNVEKFIQACEAALRI